MRPKSLGRYRIERELGRGASGHVYLARDPQFDRLVAIRSIRMPSALPEQAREEARAAGKLLHPAIVTLLDVGEAEGSFHLAMEFVEGETLDKFCDPARLLPVDLVLELICQVAEALDFAHRAGIVHRDIKPANLMRVAESTVKIMDFGLAKISEAQLTQDGALFGTPSYMSPEQIRGDALDGRSDLFSLAVVLFELLTGSRPFPGDSVSSIIYRIVNEPPSEPPELRTRVGPSLETFLGRAMEKQRDRRFSSGAEFAERLRGVAAKLRRDDSPQSVGRSTRPVDTGPSIEIPASAPVRPPRSSHLPFIVAILLLLGGLGYAAYHFRGDLGWIPAGESETGEPDPPDADSERSLQPTPEPPRPPAMLLETRVSTEPPGLPVLLDGEPVVFGDQGLLRFHADSAGTLSVTEGCRTMTHALGPSDAGGEVVLVLDPRVLSWRFELPFAETTVGINGTSAGKAPLELELDLCRSNDLTFTAPGYRTSSLEIPGGATPLEARKLLAAVVLEPIPKGWLVLPSPGRIQLVYYVDGRRLRPGETEIQLEEGEHQVRLKNESYWIDERRTIRIVGGERASPDLTPPPLTTLVVQAFPANCKVHLRRPGEAWRFFDDTPARRQVAAGSYDLRVTLNPTGEAKVQRIELLPGRNPPIRVSFASGS